MKSAIDITNAPTIDIHADAFIVPNHASPIRHHSYPNRIWYKQVCELNGVSFEQDDTMLVQLWMTSANCENLQDLYPEFRYQDGYYEYLMPSLFPAALFIGHKEGELMNVKIPITAVDSDGEHKDFLLNATIRLAQNEYRYSQYGPFECALETVLH